MDFSDMAAGLLDDNDGIPGLAIASGVATAGFALFRQATRLADNQVPWLVGLVDPNYIGGWLQMLIGVAVVGYGAYLGVRQKRLAVERAEHIATQIVRPVVLEVSRDDREIIMSRLQQIERQVEMGMCRRPVDGQARCQGDEVPA